MVQLRKLVFDQLPNCGALRRTNTPSTFQKALLLIYLFFFFSSILTLICDA